MGDAHARLRRRRRRSGPLSGPVAADEDAPADRDERPGRSAPVRDAASLVIVDDTVEPLRILVGRRASAHVFMAGKLVFPGGRLDRTDLKLAASHALPPSSRSRLLAAVGSRFVERRAVALALAAIRETYEETGLMIGRRDATFASALPVWAAFAAEGVAPDPSLLVPFARALTPPKRVRRFDTRFFAVPASAIARSAPFEERPTEEFDLVRWISPEELAGEDLAPITRRILGDLQERIGRGSLFAAEEPMPFYRRRRDGFDRRML